MALKPQVRHHHLHPHPVLQYTSCWLLAQQYKYYSNFAIRTLLIIKIKSYATLRLIFFSRSSGEESWVWIRGVCMPELRPHISAPVKPLLSQARMWQGGYFAVPLLPLQGQADPVSQTALRHATLWPARMWIICYSN